MKLNGIEFFTSPFGEVMIQTTGEPVRTLSDNYIKDRELITAFLDYISNNYTEAYKALCQLYERSSSNVFYYQYQIVSRFIRCNFGSYDTLNIDIDENGKWNFEQVHCPLRGECKLESICCSPRLNTELSQREMDVLQLIATGLKSEQIADRLYISIYTVNAHRRNILAKTKCTNTVELVNYYNNANL